MVTVVNEDDYLMHYGILRKSGRYPWGSGGNIEQRSKTFLEMIDDLKTRLGWGDKEIAEHFEMSSTELRQIRTIAKNAQKAAQISMAQRLKDNGYSNVAIGQRMGLNESTVRTLLEPGANRKAEILQNTADRLKAEIAEKKYLDVGSGTENHLDISKERKDIAIAMLLDEGYTRHYVKTPQLGTNNETTQIVLAAPGVTGKEVFANRGEIRTVTTFSDDGGKTHYGLYEPLSISPNRVAIRYKEDGGAQEDGVMYLRRGVDDLSMGDASYAQVRIKVGENKYLKGMAIYKDDLPDGVDIMFNTNKSRDVAKDDVLKDLSDDPDNPFGSYIRRQLVRPDADGNPKLVSAVNIVNEEGNWSGGSRDPITGDLSSGWSNSIASQVLSKQSPTLAKQQLGITYERRQQEFNEIMALTNPTVRKKLLEEFADGTDAAAVHLKAAKLPRQQWQVILPINSLPDNQIYAPNFRNGEQVALIRYPHGGTFEIPVLTVNNRHEDSKRALGINPRDAVGINAKVAERLSGADFDGDTVLVIPNNNRQVKTTPALQQLKGFDPKGEYAAYDGMPRISETRKQREMGDISNLITDMTIKGASHAEIARAVKHSMVVIDSEKHNLNYKQSAIDNGITALKAKYQGSARGGADTLISSAKSPVRIPDRQLRRASKGGPIDPATGRKVYEETGKTYTDASGKVIPSIIKVKKLELADNAHDLSSGTPMERIYADHSNKLKDMANQARRELVKTPRLQRSPSAARTYAAEVASLNAKLNLALRNRPLERQAQVLGNAVFRQKKAENPNMDKDMQRKIKGQALETARTRTGAKKQRVEITPKEWDAIQAGAISDSKLATILDNANMDIVKKLATPRIQPTMTSALTARAQSMLNAGYTRAEVADALGISITTLDTTTQVKDD